MVPILLTVIWLISVLQGLGGGQSAIYLLLVLLIAFGLLWLQQRRPEAWIPRVSRFFLIGLCLVVGASLLKAIGRLEASAPSVTQSEAGFRDWNLDAIEAARVEGKWVFINLTADWCVTCKVNERLVFDSPLVQDKLASEEVAAFVGDWTRGDSEITSFMAKFGRNSVPVYLLFKPGSNEPTILPQILSAQSFLKSFDGMEEGEPPQEQSK
jgi:thiol:disulfide interchange protein DsbD